ncbi:MAG: cytidylate kinase family protein [Candidatus Gracilibacteria bacterium]|nr:cytidylate kinase family protein [Candidatus Gracilibacteria bacterium]
MSHIITLGGHLGSGKSTLGKAIAEHFTFERYSTGDFMRDMALERGISLIDLNLASEKDGGIIDAILDDRQKQFGLTKDHFIIDGRLAFHFIPHALKIFLTVDPEEAARRIFEDTSRAGVESHTNIDEVLENIKIRRSSENERYKKYYNISIHNMDLYDIVIDTTGLSPNEVAEKIILEIEKRWNAQ